MFDCINKYVELKFSHNIGVIDETLKWGDNKYASLCKNKENAVTFLYSRRKYF